MNKGFHFDEIKHRYYYDGVEMTGCTTVLGVLNKPALIAWSSKMAVEWIRENAKKDTYEVEEEGDYTQREGYFVTEKELEDAKVAYAKFRDKRAGEGTDTHAKIENYIKACISLNNGIPMAHEGLDSFCKWAIENVSKFLGSEQKFYSKSLFVAGTADFTFERKDGKRYLGDIKTYKKIWDNIPFAQCAGYSIMAEEMGEEPYYGYCIVNLPPKGELECMWNFDVEGDKKAFINCVNLYRFIKKL